MIGGGGAHGGCWHDCVGDAHLPAASWRERPRLLWLTGWVADWPDAAGRVLAHDHHPGSREGPKWLPRLYLRRCQASSLGVWIPHAALLMQREGWSKKVLPCPALPLLIPLPACFPPCRHDYCGVQEDLRNWWPKLRRGGILAGHDYLNADSFPVKESKQDWSRECVVRGVCTGRGEGV